MAYHRSVSQLNSFTRCGEAFRLSRFRKDLPRRPAAWTAVGSAFHQAYEQWETEDRKQELTKLFQETYPKEITSLKLLQPDLKWWMKAPNMGKAGESYESTVERDIKARGDQGLKMCEAYEAHCRQAPWELERLELQFTLDLGGVEIKGAIDTVLKWPDGRRTVRDLKTGNMGDTQDSRQLGTYRLALNELFGYNVTWGEYWFTKTGKSGGMTDLRRYTREYLEDQYEKLDYAIDHKLFLANPGKHCELCDRKPWCREMGMVDV